MGISQPASSIAAEHQNNRREWQPRNSLFSFKETLQCWLDSRTRKEATWTLEELSGESQDWPARTPMGSAQPP